MQQFAATVTTILFFLLIIITQPAGAHERDSCAVTLIESFSIEHGIPGIAAAVSHAGVVVFNRAFGLAHIEQNTPATPSTIFQLSSTAKLFTGILVMRLVERGTLALDQPVTAYLAEAPAGWKSVTLRHCLTNSAGLPKPDDIPGALEGELAAEELLASLFELSPRPPAGEKFVYGGCDFFVAQQVIERATGKKFEQLMHDEVFTPAGMTRSTYWSRSSDILRGAATDYYPKESGGLKQREFVFPRYLFAAGGLAASAEDLLRFDTALSDGRLITQRSIDEMWKSVRLNDNSALTYGLGWDTKTHAPGQRSAGHSGGMLTTFRKYVDAEMTVVLLTNGFTRRFNPDDFASALAAVWEPSILGLEAPPCALIELEQAKF